MLNIADLVVFLMRCYKTNKHPVPGVIHQHHDFVLVAADIKNNPVILFRPRAGLCLEAQGFPDAPNQPAFPSARLAPGDVYQQRTIYEFVPGKPYS